MQNQIFYVKAASTLATACDRFGVNSGTLPEIVRGVGCVLKMRIFDGDGKPYPVDQLNCAAWEFAMDNDFNLETTPKIVADNQNISVSTVNESDPTTGTQSSFTEISIPLPQTNTSEVVEFLGTQETVSINAELVGFAAGSDVPSVIFQIKGFKIRNRMTASGTGTPENVPDGNYNASQINALLAVAPEVEFSIDGTEWHSIQSDADRKKRSRHPNVPNAEWLVEDLIVGPQGETGPQGPQGPQGEPGPEPAGVVKSINGETPDSEGDVTLEIPVAGTDVAPLGVDGKIPSQYLNTTASTHVVADIAARNSLTPTKPGERAYVIDATGDETVQSGAAEYIFDGENWCKIAEAESLDLILSWENLTGKPATFPPQSHTHTPSEAGAAPEDHDHDDRYAAKSTQHTHSNKTTLDKFGELSGTATFDGEPISGLPLASDDTPFLVWDVTNRGNDSNTKFLLQPIDSTGEIADTARGATTPAVITNSGSVSVNDSGELVFDGTNYLEIPANALPDDIFVSDHEWMFDIEFSCDDSTTIRYVFGRSDSNRIDLCIRNGYLLAGSLIDNFAPFSGGNALVTYEYFYDDTQADWVFAAYVDGNLKSTRLGQLVDYRKYPLRIGWAVDPGGRPGLDGTISMVRICNNAPYRGKSFTPIPRPYLTPITSWAPKTVEEVKTLLGIADADTWTYIASAATVNLSGANGPRQFLKLTESATINSPLLSATHPELLLQFFVPSGATATMTGIECDGPGNYQVGWIFAGGYTFRYPVVKMG